MIKALEVTEGTDLRPLVTILRRQAIPHQVTEAAGKLVVWTRSDTDAQLIQASYQAWQEGRIEVPDSQLASGSAGIPVKDLANNFLAAYWRAPITVCTILAAITLALASSFGSDRAVVNAWLFPDIFYGGSNWLSPMLWLQMLAPAMLHFGAIHLIFNTLWLWFFGRMMEPYLGWQRYLPLLLWLALAGNAAQYFWSGGQNNFGGLSGVVYGQIGFIWIWQTLNPVSPLRLPKPMIGLFIFALIAMEVLASSFIATAAHGGGLIGGMAAAGLLSLSRRR